jgi:hypothetical protein
VFCGIIIRVVSLSHGCGILFDVEEEKAKNGNQIKNSF